MENARVEIWSYLDNLFTNGQTNKQTDGQTLLVPKVAIATEKTENIIHQQYSHSWEYNKYV